MIIEILTPILFIALIFMLVDEYAPGLRVPLQMLCSFVVAVPVAFWLIYKVRSNQ